ncbi:MULTISPECIES: helix-turn-helix domain-containing protein [unclassified Streptomyces]|uniref:helix-turn-helix domain-containing protein n=1 Tax=unclassified Streptomyces TaxID=2593676 RepID=UPI002253A2D8|nr:MULTISPECIES: helix-turn-helix transcriptional regulator [unclassified Streptomyces]MCX5123691.1 helix-turn-helix transcriptional regulator [Streptomyces sp. NBC_00347]MCX5405752.1 helix-turn-helix transcriptional regulator [Streptomyces sp. NBC_00086]
MAQDDHQGRDEEAPEGVLLRGEDNVATRIKVERDKRGWSTTLVSDLLNEAGYEMNPSAVWRIENRKRRINLDEAIGFADIFDLSLSNLVGPPTLAAGPALELIDAVIATNATAQRAQHAYRRATDELAAYLDEHPEIREEADVMVSNAIAENTMKINQEQFGPPSGP